MNSLESPLPTLDAACTTCTPADFTSNQEVRWCPGCGDYSILAQTKKVLAKLGIPRSDIVFVSGIGCSSRLPYYLNTYGFHSIHGRAPTIATGLKLARPELDVWIATGDGDALSIGGNHLLHAIRRNANLKILLFNNRIYGLTKGQYSPTSLKGTKTKSSPMGSLETPLRPVSFALGCGATFVARSLAADVKHLEYTLERAAKHVGTSLVEVYQNCVIFHDGAFQYATEKDLKADSLVYLEHGKPLVFGKNREKAIGLNNRLQPQVLNVSETQPSNLLVHDEQEPTSAVSFLLSNMVQPEFPEPLGVFRAIEQEPFEALVHAQIAQAKAQRGEPDLQSMLDGPETWTVE